MEAQAQNSQLELEIDVECLPEPPKEPEVHGDILDYCHACGTKNVECYSCLPMEEDSIVFSSTIHGYVCEKCHHKNNGDEIMEYQSRKHRHQYARQLIWLDIKKSEYTGEQRIVLTEVYIDPTNKKRIN